jgi:calcineurin-like phosphoesterase family protein
MSVFFTSDTHFSHASMVQKSWRPRFTSVAEMNDCMITRWNETVRRDDSVWHLGDWAMGNFQAGLHMCSKLNGKIHLIPGNHDRCHPAYRDSYKYQSAYFNAGFASVQAFARKNIGGQQVLLSHLPYKGDRHDAERFDQYRLKDQGLWLLHGHVHEAWKIQGKQINVGVDQWDFYPVSLDVISRLIKGDDQ